MNEAANVKTALRKHIISLRDALSGETRRAYSEIITRKILSLEVYRNARVVMAYMTFGSEFETGGLIKAALAEGKEVALPKVNRKQRGIMDLYLVHDLARDLEPGVWGIPEPRPETCKLMMDLSGIDFILAPGVAFGRGGERLGYGGGYYDRLLSRLPTLPVLVAAAFSLQVVEGIPVQPNDRMVDLVITENAEFNPHGTR